MQDEDLKGIIFICELDQNTLNEDEIYKFISSIEIDVTGLRISSLKDTLDNDLISKAEYKIRKKEILENHYPITNKLEELRLKRLKHKITCSEFKYEMRNILKVKFHRYENNCKNVTYLGPIISGYQPQ